MSYQYSVQERRRRTANAGGYGHSGQRSTFGYWVPLVLTVTAATIGIAAWIWSERQDDEESEDEHYPGGVPPAGPASMSGALPPGAPPPGGFQGPPGVGPQGFQGPMDPMSGPMPGPNQPGGFQGPPGAPGFPQEGGYRDLARSTGVEQQQEETTLVARMSNALGFGRSSSPAQTYNWASKTVAAGVAAAGAAVGGALSTFNSGDKEGFDDHERWSEEAEQRDNDREIKRGIKRQGTADEYFSQAVEMPRAATISNQKRKTVAIVVSAVEHQMDGETDLDSHASMLAHLPEFLNPDTTRVFVLIYAPNLKTHPLSPLATGKGMSMSMTSSFSNISHMDTHTPAQTPGDFPKDGILSQVEPNPIDEAPTLYKTLHNQAMALVDKDSMIFPFTTPQGHKHILRSLAPEVLYIQESLCGRDGEIVSELSGWVKQTVVVYGDEGGVGGLADTDDESVVNKPETWWQKEERTGLGKRVTVVESVKIGEDWRRRVNEKD